MLSGIRVKVGGILAAMSVIWLIGLAGTDDISIAQGDPTPLSVIVAKGVAGVIGLFISLTLINGGLNDDED